MTSLYLILFLICIIFVFLEDYIKDKDKLICYVVTCGIMIWIAATKDVIDTPDAINYEHMFYGGNVITELMTEPTFLFIAQILRNLGFTVSALFAVYAILNIGIKGEIIYKMSPFPILTLFIYISYLYILHDLIQIRVGAALAFGVGALYYYCYDNKWKTAVMIVVATFFHYSAALLFLIFLFSNNPLTIKWKLLLYAIVPFGLMLCLLKLNLLSLIPSFAGGEKVDVYKEMAEKGNMDDATLIDPILWIKIIVYLVALWNYNYLSEFNRFLSLFIKLMGLSILIELSLLFTNAIMAYRLSELFCIVEPFIITTITYLFRPLWLGRLAIVFIGTISAFYCIFILEYIIT